MRRARLVAWRMSSAAPVVTDFAAEHQLLGDAAAEHRGELRLELGLGDAVFVALRQPHGDAERAPARNDRHLVQRVVALGVEHDEGVPALVTLGHGMAGIANDLNKNGPFN